MKTPPDPRTRLQLLSALDQQKAECRDILAGMEPSRLRSMLDHMRAFEGLPLVQFALLGLTLTMEEQR